MLCGRESGRHMELGDEGSRRRTHGPIADEEAGKEGRWRQDMDSRAHPLSGHEWGSY